MYVTAHVPSPARQAFLTAMVEFEPVPKGLTDLAGHDAERCARWQDDGTRRCVRTRRR